MNYKYYVWYFGLIVLGAAYITFSSIFLCAMMNDSICHVNFNFYNEAKLEAVLLLISFPFVMFTVYISHKLTYREFKI